MGFLDKIKKSIELKQNSPSEESLHKTQKKISKLEKELVTNPDNFSLLLDLYGCYVEISNTEKKIECLERLSDLKPNDSYPFQQLADIYNHELNDEKQAQIYQNKANKINGYF